MVARMADRTRCYRQPHQQYTFADGLPAGDEYHQVLYSRTQPIPERTLHVYRSYHSMDGIEQMAAWPGIELLRWIRTVPSTIHHGKIKYRFSDHGDRNNDGNYLVQLAGPAKK